MQDCHKGARHFHQRPVSNRPAATLVNGGPGPGPARQSNSADTKGANRREAGADGLPLSQRVAVQTHAADNGAKEQAGESSRTAPAVKGPP